MPILQVFDTSVLIPWLRNRICDQLITSSFHHHRFTLCTVVWMELYAGTKNRADKRDLDQMQQSLSGVGRVLSPAPEDFYAAGQIMSFYSRTYGRVDPTHHTNDILIALCAARAGAEFITMDAGHIQQWQNVFKRFKKPLYLCLVS